jgi:hypothetical protein
MEATSESTRKWLRVIRAHQYNLVARQRGNCAANWHWDAGTPSVGLDSSKLSTVAQVFAGLAVHGEKQRTNAFVSIRGIKVVQHPLTRRIR